MSIGTIAQKKDFALPALLTVVTLSYVCMVALWLRQLV